MHPARPAHPPNRPQPQVGLQPVALACLALLLSPLPARPAGKGSTKATPAGATVLSQAPASGAKAGAGLAAANSGTAAGMPNGNATNTANNTATSAPNNAPNSAGNNPPTAAHATAAAARGPAAADASSPAATGVATDADAGSDSGLAPTARFAQMARLLDLPEELPVPGRSAGAGLALPKALTAALAHSTDVEAARQRLASFGHASAAARGALLPQIDLRTSAGYGVLSSVEPASKLARSDTTLSVRQVVYDESLRRQFGQRKLLVDSAQLQHSSAVSQALLEGGLAYLEALRLRVVIELGQAHEVHLDELLRYIGDRAKAGGTSPAERDRVRSRVANLRASLADAQSAMAAALRNLQRLTGVEPLSLGVGGPLPVKPITDRQAVLAQARSANAELLAARAEVVAAEADQSVQRARHLPRVELEVARNRSSNMGGSEGHIQDHRAMLSLSMPIYHGGADQAQIDAAGARRAELDARTLGVERRLTMEVETAFANLESARIRFEAVRDEVAANRSVVEAFRAQLVGGNRPLLDVLDAYQRLHQSRIDLAQLLVSDAQTQLRLAHLSGSLAQSLQAADAPATPR